MAPVRAEGRDAAPDAASRLKAYCPASQRSDLTPVYAFNGAGLWLAQQRGLGKTVEGGSNNIGFWRDLIARMGKEFD